MNRDGVIYEKDLGTSTGAAAEAMTAFNPDRTGDRSAEESGYTKGPELKKPSRPVVPMRS